MPASRSFRRRAFRGFAFWMANALLPAFALLAQPAPPPDPLRALYQQRQWFRLRETVQSAAAPPPFYRAAVMAAFHDDRSALRLLAIISGQEPDSWEAAEAGRLAEIVRLRTEHHQRTPGSRPTSLRTPRRGDHLCLPASIQGRAVEFLLDTGAGLSLISASTAKLLALEIHDVGRQSTDGAGPEPLVWSQVGVAREFVAGAQEIRDVLFIVLPDDTPFFSGRPLAAQGVVGLPLIQAFETVRWDRDGHLDLGYPAQPPANETPSLAFDVGYLVTELRFRGQPLRFRVDTGADGTCLYARFGVRFPDMLPAGKRASRRRAGVAGPIDYELRILPRVTLDLAGEPLSLAPAELMVDAAIGHGFDGNLGQDLLLQRTAVVLDFRHMQLRLEPATAGK